MTVDGMAAARALLERRTCTPGLCLHYVWQAYKAQGARAVGTYGTAYAAWEATPGKHHGDRNPPPGVPVWWGPRAGSAAGDVTISLGGGRIAATDWPRNGLIGETTIEARTRQIGRPYLGWTETILGHPISLPTPAAAPAAAPTTTEDDTMPITILERADSAKGKSLYDVRTGRAIRGISRDENTAMRRAQPTGAVVYITVSDAEYAERGGK